MADRTHGDIMINAEPAQIMNVIADLPRYPEWSEGVERIEVLSHTPSGRPQRARFHFASGPIRDTFVVDYQWDDDSAVDWTLSEGGMLQQMDGRYELTPEPNGGVRVSYDLVVGINVPMIGMIKTKAEKRIIRSALQGLKQRVEQMA